MPKRYLILPLLLAFLAPASLRAQETAVREQVLRCVPPDYGICFILNDLRGHSERLDKLGWVKTMSQSPLARALFASKEFRDILNVQAEMKKHLGIDWPTLRDDVLGDVVALAYRPAPEGTPEDEQGLLLLHARKADALTELIKRLNTLQKSNKELTALEERTHKDVKYYRRATNKATHYYLQDGPFLAFTGSEAAIRWIIERRQNGDSARSAIGESLRRAGAETELINLWVNPRVFDKEIKAKAGGEGADASFHQFFLTYWQAIDGVVASLNVGESLELRLSVQARAKDLPAGAQKLFRDGTRPSELWARFPDNAVFAMAGRADFAALVTGLADASPPEVRKKFVDGLKDSVGAALGLNVLRDVLPNLGPDWGACVLPAADDKQMPQVLAALAVRPGEKQVDQAIYGGMSLLAGWATVFHNKNMPDQPIRLRTVMQDKVEVKYLAGDKAFPPGIEPAFALKDGYLVVASSPAAIARFKAGAGKMPDGNESPIMRLSATEAAKLLRGQREKVIDHIAEKNHIPKEAAAAGLEGALAVLDLIDRVELSERSGDGQLTMILRIRPNAK